MTELLPPVPDRTCVRIIDAADEKPIPHIVVLIDVVVPRKNNYALGPFITDRDGAFEFSRSDIESEIDLSRRVVLMDYAATIEEVTALVVEVASPARLDGLLRAREIWGEATPEWKLSLDTVAQIRTSENRKYAAKTVRISRGQFREHLIITISLSRSECNS